MESTETKRERQDVRFYLDANGDASARTRRFTVVLIVASVLTAIGVLNSLQASWMSKRLDRWRSSDSSYLVSHIGPMPSRDEIDSRWQDRYVRDLGCYNYWQSTAAQAGGSGKASPSQLNPNVPAWCVHKPTSEWYLRQAREEYEQESDLYHQRYHAFWVSASRALVDNRFFVHVPFFGLNFDVNDLGMLAGVGLVSIMLLLRFSLRTELENLRLSFSEMQKLKYLAEFYRLAAMRQVLTIPTLPERQAGRFEVWLPKPIDLLPLAVYLWLFGHDLSTSWIGNELNTARMWVLIGSEVCFLAAIIALAIQCFMLARGIDSTWTDGWFRYIAEQFERTGDGEWLRHANQAYDRGQALPRNLVDILPRESEVKDIVIHSYDESNDTHTYQSRDGVQLAVNIRANSVVLETIKLAARQYRVPSPWIPLC